MDPYSNFVVQFDEEIFALEAQLADLGPAKGVDFCVSLWNKKMKHLENVMCFNPALTWLL